MVGCGSLRLCILHVYMMRCSTIGGASGIIGWWDRHPVRTAPRRGLGTYEKRVHSESWRG
jgi:hypothetical protein